MYKVTKAERQCTKCKQNVEPEEREYHCDSCDKLIDTNKSHGWVNLDTDWVKDNAPELMFCSNGCIFDWLASGKYEKYYRKWGVKKNEYGGFDISLRHIKHKDVMKLINRLK